MDDCVVAGLYYFVNVPAEIPQPLKMSTRIFLGVKMAAAYHLHTAESQENPEP